MIRRILILLALILSSAYLVVAVTVFNGKPTTQVCKSIELNMKDSSECSFVNHAEITSLLKRNKLYPINQPLKDINIRLLEEAIRQHPFVKTAECFFTSGGNVAANIYQRIPILRIMGNNGEDYYLDNEGQIMVAPGKSVQVAVATGNIDRHFAQTELYELGKYLQNHPFWEAQIEQINVTARKELELVPRVGNHLLFLGKPGDYNEKFTKLQTFYEKALNKVGWNKYSRISIEFTNQIICTKKEK